MTTTESEPKPESRKATQRSGHTMGIRGKLFVAMAAAGSTAVIAAAVGWMSFGQTKSALEAVSHEAIPALLASNTLAESSAGFAGMLSNLHFAETEAALERRVTGLENSTQRMRDALLELDRADRNDRQDGLGSEIDAMAAMVATHADAVAERITIAGTLRENVALASRQHDALAEILDPYVMDARFTLNEQGEALTQIVNESTRSLIDGAARDLERVLTLRGDVINLFGILRQAQAATSIDAVEALEGQFRDKASDADIILLNFFGRDGFEDVVSLGEELLLHADADTSIFGLRSRQLEEQSDTPSGDDANASLEEALAGAATEAGTLESALLGNISGVVSDSRQDMRRAGQSLTLQISSQIGRMMGEDLRDLVNLLEIHALANLIAGMADEAATTRSEADLRALGDQLDSETQSLDTTLAFIRSPEVRENLKDALSELMETVGAPEVGIIALREKLLQADQSAAALLADNQTRAASLLGAVADRTTTISAGAVNDGNAAMDLLDRSRLLLVAIAVAGVLVSVLIAWLYVGRSIVRRLTGLASSMNDLADGRLDVA
ncbi:hypothetical protein, partial [Fodinicurvata sp. EGI_FJ10296]|uniref:hypothetical protein n=1 Tax=Fodinicurvata sp. EGI_FJ10296 TaxID=3231908 RepID=UPI00345447B3